MAPLPLLCPCHLFAPELGRLPFYGSIGTDLSLGLRKPPDFSSILSLDQNNKVRKILPRSVVLVVGQRKSEKFVLQIFDDVFCVVQKVCKRRFKVSVTGYL